jgi:hypothetical protein
VSTEWAIVSGLICLASSWMLGTIFKLRKEVQIEKIKTSIQRNEAVYNFRRWYALKYGHDKLNLLPDYQEMLNSDFDLRSYRSSYIKD